LFCARALTGIMRATVIAIKVVMAVTVAVSFVCNEVGL